MVAATAKVEKELSEEEIILLQAVKLLIPTCSRFGNEQLAKKIGRDKLTDCTDELFGYIQSGVSSPLSKIEQLALTHKVLSILRDFLKEELKQIVTVKTFTNSFDLIPEAVGRSFPDYHESKLLRYCVLSKG